MKLTNFHLFIAMFFFLTLSVRSNGEDKVLSLSNPKLEELTASASKMVRIPTNHDTVVAMLNTAIRIAEQENNQHEKINILNLRGLNEYYSGNYEGAVDYYYRVLEIAQQNSDSIFIAKGNHNLGMVYDELEDFGEAIQYFEKSMGISELLKDSAQMAKTYQNIAICFQNKKEIEEARRFIAKAHKIALSMKDTVLTIDLINNLGTIDYDEGKLDESLNNYLKALDLYWKRNDKRGIAYAYNNIGLVWLDKKEYSKSLDYFKKSLDIANRLKMYDLTADIYSNLTIYYKELKNYELAYFYYDKFNVVYDSLIGEKKDKTIRQIQAKYLLGQKDRELQELKSQNQSQESKIDSARSFQIYLAGITILVVLLMIATFYLLFKEKKLAEQLKIKSDEFRQLNASKDKFFSIIAHDLKNPFNVLVSYTSLLKTDIDMFSKEELQQIMKDLNQASENGFDLLQNLLLWTRSQTNRIHIFKTDFNLNNIVENVKSLVELNLVAKEQKLVCEVDAGIMVHADKEMISTVVRNLVFNAMKFSPKKSQITVKASVIESNVQVDIADSGIGMTKETIAKLFKIDQNVSTQGTEGETGTGLGLVICREFIEKNDGKIWVESEPGKGSVFSFIIPLTKA